LEADGNRACIHLLDYLLPLVGSSLLAEFSRPFGMGVQSQAGKRVEAHILFYTLFVAMEHSQDGWN
jgi:hypothetical protein